MSGNARDERFVPFADLRMRQLFCWQNENIYRFQHFYPEGAYGNVTGYIELPTLPKIGEAIVLLKNELSQSGVGFSGPLRLMTILPVEGYGSEYTVYALEDAETNSLDDARKFGNRLEAECGLFCVAYHDDWTAGTR